jgi:drug/metabolite transporter (DMT)-like permease
VHIRALLLLGGAQLAIGAAAIFARFALTAAGPLSVAALRLGIGAAPVVALALARGRYRLIDAATERRLALAGAVLALHFATWIASLRFASVAVATLVVCTTPVFTEAWEIARSGRVRARPLASVLLAGAGVALVVGAPSRTETPAGIALAATGALAMAVYLLLVRTSDARYTTLAVVGRTFPLACLLLALAAALAGDVVPPLDAHAAWGGILAMALGSQLFGHTALNAAVRRLSPTFVATTTLLEPAIAALLAALIFGERLSGGTLVGALAILAGIALAIPTASARR